MLEMKTSSVSETLSRREMLARALAGSLGLGMIAPAAEAVAAAPVAVSVAKPEFVPENDYPFFCETDPS